MVQQIEYIFLLGYNKIPYPGNVLPLSLPQTKECKMTQQYSNFMRWTSRVVIISMLAISMPEKIAIAGMVETGQVASHELAMQDRARISALLDREDVLAQLQQQGVSPGEAKARVNALTDDEAHNIAGKLDQLPAGGDIIGALVFVFIVLLITDILGFTKVFPFTRPINKR
jgi:Family of unknown function (DUF6627)